MTILTLRNWVLENVPKTTPVPKPQVCYDINVPTVLGSPVQYTHTDG